MVQTSSASSVYSPVEKEDDDIWITQAIAGNKEAFSSLYNRYHQQVHAFCMRMLQGRPDVEDAVQQVFLEAWRSLYRFERRSLFSTWLTKIAIHTCLSFHRKNTRLVLAIDDHDELMEDSQNIVWANGTHLPDEQLWLTARRHALGKVLEKMTRKKQLVFMMSEVQGMTAPEIASRLKIPDATVRTRLFHARREFLQSINKNPIYKDLFKELNNKKIPSKTKKAKKSNG